MFNKRYIKPPFFARNFSNLGAIWEKPSAEKILYLTFDDGPIPELTPFILDILKLYNIQATFFCVGENIIKNKLLFNKIIQNNHKVGNHTFNHLNGWTTSNKNYFENIEKFQNIFQTNLFRPPYGKIKPSQIKYLNNFFDIILWSVLSYDFDKSLTPFNCLQIVNENIYNGAIVVFHDNVKAKDRITFALPRFIEECLVKGYKFGVL